MGDLCGLMRAKCDVATGRSDELLEKTTTWSDSVGLEEGFLPVAVLCGRSVL